MRASPSGTPVAVTRTGTGPEVLLVHGGASPATTWSGLERLSERWTLAFLHRRGYPPSPPPPSGHQDFELDAADLCELLDGRPHLVAHSYGGVAAAIAATSRPDRVRSLTLLEPALFLPADDPEVAWFRRIGDEVLACGMETDPETLRTFLKISGAPVPDEGPLPDEVVRGVNRAHGGRPPSQAHPPLEVIREAGIPSLVVSGGHQPALEQMCDAVATELGGARLVAPGAGHFVAAAPGFAPQLEAFLDSAGA
jgi:pimeloyl-ACP methyl ester carboxylesterase